MVSLLFKLCRVRVDILGPLKWYICSPAEHLTVARLTMELDHFLSSVYLKCIESTDIWVYFLIAIFISYFALYERTHGIDCTVETNVMLHGPSYCCEF
jgi:hypothetical protein